MLVPFQSSRSRCLLISAFQSLHSCCLLIFTSDPNRWSHYEQLPRSTKLALPSTFLLSTKCGSLPTIINLDYLHACNMSSAIYYKIFAVPNWWIFNQQVIRLATMSTTLFPNNWDHTQLGSSPFNQIKHTTPPQTHTPTFLHNLDENDQFISVQLCLQADSRHHNVLGLLDPWGFT